MNKMHALPQKKITIRDLARNTREIKEAVKKGQSYVVYEKTEPIFSIYPTLPETNKKYSMLELQNLKGFIGKKSQDNRSIDEIVYGK